MVKAWEADHLWGQQFLGPIRMLLGLNCIQIADIEEDRKHNTDLMFDVHHARYPVRVRRITDRLEFNRRNEITLRFSRRSQVQTEFSKLMHGWGDCFMYCWGDERSQRVPSYTLLDLHALRGWLTDIVADRLFAATGASGLPLGVTLFDDKDGSATFLAFCLDCLPPHIIQHRLTALPDDPPIRDAHWRKCHDPLRAAA
jgi:hypothetical protein